jgi:2-oxoglutarate ferredoxin oxidoreductase subunit gamma
MKETQNRHEIVMAGSGGQGLVLAGIILAEAAIVDGKNVIQTQSYGIASRGGFSQAEVICDREEIVYPHVEKPDLILVMTREALAKHRPHWEKGTFLLFDTTLVEVKDARNCQGLPLTDMAAQMGNPGVANLIALGAIAALTGAVGLASLEAVVAARFSPKAREVNLQALALGAKTGRISGK